MRRYLTFLILPIGLAVTGCADLLDEGPKTPELTPLEIQSLQQRNLETSKDVAFASVVSVFQDLGYTITSADKDTGLINGESLAKSDSDVSGAELLLDLLADEDEAYDVVTVQTKATAFVESFIEGQTRVRLSFVRNKSRSGSSGQLSQKDKQVLDAEIYRNAFDRIENAIFVRGGGGS